jgi:uncharacterized protein (DUF2141 family)
MIKLVIISLFFNITLFSTIAFSLELTVEIKNTKQLDKKIMMELFLLTDNNPDNWNDIQLIEKKTVELYSELKFHQLEKGRYALRVFQDVNNNGVLDKSASEIPKEPIGFSANPSLFGGEPLPQDSAIELNRNTTIYINLKHRKVRKKRKKSF